MKKLFYIDQVQRNNGTTILKCYAVEAETFEEAITLHNNDWENLKGKSKFPPELAYMAEDLVDGWSLRRTEEIRGYATPEEKEAQRLRIEQYRKENGIDDEIEEVECLCNNCEEI